MTECGLCSKEIKKHDDFIVVGKYPSGWMKFAQGGINSPEDFGRIYHKDCFIDAIEKGAKL